MSRINASCAWQSQKAKINQIVRLFDYLPRRFSFLVMTLFILGGCDCWQRSTLNETFPIPILISPPEGIDSYTGWQPVAFGVPLEKGVLSKTELANGHLKIRTSGSCCSGVRAQFEPLSYWWEPPVETSAGVEVPEPEFIQWLLVEFMVEFEDGDPVHDYELALDDGTVLLSSSPSVTAEEHPTQHITVNTGADTFVVGPDPTNNSFGQFKLEVVKEGDPTIHTYTANKGTGYTLSTLNSEFISAEEPTRFMVTERGLYLSESGDSIASYITRYHFYSGVPFVRVFHTLIWETDDTTKIKSLRYVHHEISEGIRFATVGVDGALTHTLEPIYQTSPNTVTGKDASGYTLHGTHLDGWLTVQPLGRPPLFMGLRWPWQQYPVSLHANAVPTISMIGTADPNKPMPLKPTEIWGGITGDKKLESSLTVNDISPYGIAKTYELMVWQGDNSVPPQVKNQFLQHPVLAYADPVMATHANLPSPASSVQAEKYPIEEAAISRAFDWFTRSLTTINDHTAIVDNSGLVCEEYADCDYGTWNFGDLQWWWNGYTFSDYRYWMNQGKGWSVLPWALWIRSGDRRYWENGEANGRHIMDVDTSHVECYPTITCDQDNPPEGYISHTAGLSCSHLRKASPTTGLCTPEHARKKRVGAAYRYAAIHWAYPPTILNYWSDSEYLANYYYMTGYERAKEVLDERYNLVKDQKIYAKKTLRTHLQPQTLAKSVRDTYASLKELLILWQYSGDLNLYYKAHATLDAVLAAQRLNSGRFPKITSNHYLNQGLMMALNYFPSRAEEIKAALTDWHSYEGRPWQRNRWASLGPTSLWSLILEDDADETEAITRAVGVMRAQALGVFKDTTEEVVDFRDKFNGITSFAAHTAGPILRDWLITMKAADEVDINTETAVVPTASHIHGRLPVDCKCMAQKWHRHLALVKDAEGKGFSFSIEFNDKNMGSAPIPLVVEVYTPNGERHFIDTAHEIRSPGINARNPTVTECTVTSVPCCTPGNSDQACEGCCGKTAFEFSPTSDDGLNDEGQLTYHNTVLPQIPNDTEDILLKGVYEIHIWTQADFPPAMRVRSSLGNVVNYMPDGPRTMVSNAFGGTLCVKTLSDHDFTVGPITDQKGLILTKGITGILPEIGDELETSSDIIANNTLDYVPYGGISKTLSVTRTGAPAEKLRLFISNEDQRTTQSLAGLEPYIAFECDEWFDPTQPSPVENLVPYVKLPDVECNTGGLTVHKTVIPNDDPGAFDILINDEVEARGIGHGGTVAMSIPGCYQVGERANNDETNLDDYQKIIGGDCTPNEKLQVGHGETKTCTITNIRISSEPVE